LPAPAAAGAEKKRRKVLREQTNTPAIMPAPTECSAPRIRGKARSRTNAPSVGAAQRLGPNLEKLSDTAECFAVEGTVTGELGRQHYACGVAVGIIGRRVPPGSRGGPVSVEDKKAAAEAPIEMFVLAHDSGKQAGKQAAPGGFSEHFVGRCLEKIAQKMLAVPVADGQLRSPPVNAEVVIVPRWLLCRGWMDVRRCIRLTLSRRRCGAGHRIEACCCEIARRLVHSRREVGSLLLPQHIDSTVAFHSPLQHRYNVPDIARALASLAPRCSFKVVPMTQLLRQRSTARTQGDVRRSGPNKACALHKLLDEHDIPTSIVDTNLQIRDLSITAPGTHAGTFPTTWSWLSPPAAPPDMEELLTQGTCTPAERPQNMPITPHESIAGHWFSYNRLQASRGGGLLNKSHSTKVVCSGLF
jgi:hypothetical protein